MKFDCIGLQGVAAQSKILFSSILSLCKLYEIVFIENKKQKEM